MAGTGGVVREGSLTAISVPGRVRGGLVTTLLLAVADELAGCVAGSFGVTRLVPRVPRREARGAALFAISVVGGLMRTALGTFAPVLVGVVVVRAVISGVRLVGGGGTDLAVRVGAGVGVAVAEGTFDGVDFAVVCLPGGFVPVGFEAVVLLAGVRVPISARAVSSSPS